MQLKCRFLGATHRYSDSVAQLGAEEPVSLAVSGKCTPRQEMQYCERRPEAPKSTSADFPAVPRAGPGGEVISVGKGISDFWVESPLSMPNINIVFHLRVSVHFLLPHLSNCDDRTITRLCFLVPPELFFIYLLKIIIKFKFISMM